MCLRPLDASRGQRGRERGLVNSDCVGDEGEVDVAELREVVLQVTARYTLATWLLVSFVGN